MYVYIIKPFLTYYTIGVMIMNIRQNPKLFKPWLFVTEIVKISMLIYDNCTDNCIDVRMIIIIIQ